MRIRGLFALLVATLLLVPVAAQTTAPLSTWQGQIYTRATWLQGKTAALSAVGNVNLNKTNTSTTASGTFVLQGSSGTALWNLSGIVLTADFTDTRLGARVTGHVAHVLAYGPYRVGTTSTLAVMEVWTTVPDTGTPSLSYKINALDKLKPPTYQGAPMKPLVSGLTIGAGYAWIFLPLKQGEL